MTDAPATLVFRDLTADDLDGVIEIERQSFERPWSRDHFLRELKSEISRTLVARSADTEGIVGYICRWVIADEMQILNVAVRHDQRRRGIARQMMEQVLEEARGNGIACVILEVREGNVEAAALYASLGFAPVGRRRDYYGEGHAGVLMTLTLKGESGPERT